MRSAFALRIFSGRIILNFAFVALCGALQTHFHGRGRNGKRHLQRCFLRKRGAAVSVLALSGANAPALPRGEPLAWRYSFRLKCKVYGLARVSPFGRGGTAYAVTERASPFGISHTQKKAARQLADSLFQKKIRKTRAQKGRVSIRTYFRPCSARCARTAPTRLRSRRGRRCAPDT